jgi:predicted enzyme related to lactoylglutathione lyase
MEQARNASPFCHIVIPAPDLEKARLFYEQVFGWRVQEKVPGETYWFFESGNVGGAFDGNLRPATRSVVLVLRVEDIASTLSLVAKYGGLVTRPPSLIGEASPGRDAYFRDPNGNELGIYSER